MSTSLICERSFEFARRLVPLCDRLARSGLSARHVAGQLIRTGTSICANAHEAQEGQTKPDFIAKMSVSRKEAREANFWLRFAASTNIVSPSEIVWELEESMDLLRMIRKAIRTAQSNPDRGDSSPKP
jgi:four helix bundle protein